MLELSIHGNPFIAQRLLEDLYARGCRPADPGEFTRRAFLNGRMDLAQAEAVMDVIAARSERALAAANRQLRGALSREMSALTASLVTALAQVEAYIDFPEEDLPPEDRQTLLARIEELQTRTSRLLATQHYGDLLREGFKVAIVGAPNAGKSSLLNRLLGRDRALVSPEPGTTRDFIEEPVMIGPHLFRLVDTAGLNPTPGEIERLGIAKTEEWLKEADILLHLVDATTGADPSQSAANLPSGAASEGYRKNIALFLGEAGESRPRGKEFNSTEIPDAAPKRITVANKTDVAAPPRGVDLAISAKTGAGLEDLRRALISLADSLQPAAGEESLTINARHAQALTDARDSLAAAAEKLRVAAASASYDATLLASDLRATLDAYGRIAGRIDHERVLDELFAAFCIGK